MKNYELALKALDRAEELGLDMDRWQPDSADPECGTACCFAGHLVELPEARALGLSVVGTVGRPALGRETDGWRPEGSEAIALFFGIDEEDADLLTACWPAYYKHVHGADTRADVTVDMVREALRKLHAGGTLIDNTERLAI